MKYLSAIQKRQLRGIQVMSLLLILFSYVFYFNSKKVEDITFGFVIDQEWQLINEWLRIVLAIGFIGNWTGLSSI
jgi:hypothetical protein